MHASVAQSERSACVHMLVPLCISVYVAIVLEGHFTGKAKGDDKDVDL